MNSFFSALLLILPLLLILALSRMGYLFSSPVLTSMLERLRLSPSCKADFDVAFFRNYSTSFIKSLPHALKPQASSLFRFLDRSAAQMNKGLLFLLFAILLLPSINANAASFYMGGVCYAARVAAYRKRQNKKTLTVLIAPELVERLDGFMLARDETKNQVVERALREFFRKR